MNPRAPGLLAWPAAMIVWGPGFTAARHIHHCAQLIMVMRGTLRIRSGPGNKWKSCGAALVRPDAVHEIQAQLRSTLLIAFVDVESELGAGLSDTVSKDISPIPAKRVAQWRAVLGTDLNQAQIERWLRSDLFNAPRPVKLHPGVNRVLKHVRERLGRTEEFSLTSLAAPSGLSQSRFMHVFTESVGVALRPYILWLRLQRAACNLMDGASATEAAHLAGFADGAHLTRTFRRMLGVTPTDLALRRRMSQRITP